LDQLHGPLFRTAEGGVDEGLGQIQLPARQQILGQGAQDRDQRAFPHPALEAAMAGLVRRKFVFGQFRPLRSGSQNP
jgi:hypothetical protein